MARASGYGTTIDREARGYHYFDSSRQYPVLVDALPGALKVIGTQAREDLAPRDAELLLREMWGDVGRCGEVWRGMGRSCATGCGTPPARIRLRLRHQAGYGLATGLRKERLLSDQALKRAPHKERRPVVLTGHQAGTRQKTGLLSDAV